MGELLLRNARLWGAQALTDLHIVDGHIAAGGLDGPRTPVCRGNNSRVPSTAADDPATVDLGGRLVLPGFVDAHCHLDKTLWAGPWVPNTAGPRIQDKIAYTRARRAEFGVPSVPRITALLERMAAAGTAHVRTHTDISPEIGLDGLHAVRAAAESLADRITVQQVTFPQFGMLTNPGTVELMDRALRSGAAQVVGGIDPAGVDRDPVRHLDIVFGLALTHDVPLDLHLHDRGELGAWELELIIERTLATGMGHRVTIGHGYALGEVGERRRNELIAGLAEAGISVVTCAAHNDPLPPMRAMACAGATLAAGNDGVRDLWSPYGDGDMLHRAHRLAERLDCYSDDEIELALRAATFGGAAALGVPGYGLGDGARADLVVPAARSAAEAVVTRAPRTLVVHAGQVVAP